MYSLRLISIVMLISLLAACTEVAEVIPEVHDWDNLIDEDLSKWDTYLSFKHQLGYDGTPPVNAAGELIKPVGLNQPGYNVFSVAEEDGEKVIEVTGEYYGCLATKKEYENYHFQLKYKWGEKKWVPRMELLKDSGILYHSGGEFGVEHWRSWMMSQEFQIMESHSGDFWSQASSAIDIRAYKPESGLNPMAHETQDFLPFGEGSSIGKYCLRAYNNENAHDEWNTLDLYCFEDKSLHVVNGKVVMILQNSRYADEDGKMIPMTKGKIQLQSEAAELFFKDIKIRSIDGLSKAHGKLF